MNQVSLALTIYTSGFFPYTPPAPGSGIDPYVACRDWRRASYTPPVRNVPIAIRMNGDPTAYLAYYVEVFGSFLLPCKEAPGRLIPEKKILWWGPPESSFLLEVLNAVNFVKPRTHIFQYIAAGKYTCR